MRPNTKAPRIGKVQAGSVFFSQILKYKLFIHQGKIYLLKKTTTSNTHYYRFRYWFVHKSFKCVPVKNYPVKITFHHSFFIFIWCENTIFVTKGVLESINFYFSTTQINTCLFREINQCHSTRERY